MNGFSLYSSISPWFILLCILAGAFYSYLLYSKQPTLWSKKTNLSLAALRFVLVTLLVYLLFGPVIRYLENSKEQPTVLIQIDNSESLTFVSDSSQRTAWLNRIHAISEGLNKEGIQTYIHSFNGRQDLNTILFQYPTSNIHHLLQQSKQEATGKNISASILISDGIYNAGMDPSISPSSTPIYTIGIGDTTTKKDVTVTAAIYNKISYKGNEFPMLAEISQKGYSGKTATVQLKHKGKLLTSKKITFSKDPIQPMVEFRAIAENVGIQHYTIEVLPLENEFTPQNNIQHIYVEVIDNKQKILIAAPSAHPDIKAIQAALSSKDNIEVVLFIPGITEYKEQLYSLVILHHYPDGSSIAKKEFDKIISSTTPKWYIISNQTSISAFSQSNGLLQIQTKGNQKDLSFGELNTSFDRFIMPIGMQELLQGAPPLQCPFGEFKLMQDGVNILHQRIGRVSTQKPMLSVSSDRTRMVLAGEGIWQWRLYEQSIHQNTASFDEFIQKCIQYLSNDKDKRKFRVYPTTNDVQKGEKIYFEAELYNDIMERVYGTEISLKIRNENGNSYSYSFSTSAGNNRFEVKGLGEGVYSYSASATLNGKAEKSIGEFIIRKTSLEALQTKADFNVLKTISAKSNGVFYTMEQSDSLLSNILSRQFKTVIHSKETLNEIINLPWIFFILVLLVSSEWIIRKLQGGY